MSSATFTPRENNPRIVDLELTAFECDPDNMEAHIIELITNHIEDKRQRLEVDSNFFQQVFYQGRIPGSSHIIFKVTYPHRAAALSGLTRGATYSVNVLIRGEPAPYFLVQVPEITRKANQPLYAVRGVSNDL